MIDPENFYRDLIESLLPDKALLSVEDVLSAIKDIDTMDALPLMESMAKKKLAKEHIYPLLRALYFTDATVKLLSPETIEERQGLTKSYLNSYEELKTLVCSQCGSSEISVKDSESKYLYCSNQCYKLDYNKFY
jgi:hypothetical protein